MRSLFARILLLGLSVSIAGCVADGPRQPFASRSLWKKPASAADEKEQEKESASASTAKTENPFRKAAETSKAEPAASSDAKAVAEKPPEDKSAGKTSGEEPSKSEVAAAAASEPSPTKSESKATGSFNFDTMKLINAELTDATVEERAFWYDQLKHVDPAVIPQILQARRLTAEIVEQRRRETAPPDPGPAQRDDPFESGRSIRQTSGRELEAAETAVTASGVREFPRRDADPFASRSDAEGQSFRRPEGPPATASERPAYAVQQRGAGGDAGMESPPAATNSSSFLPSLSSSRNALNRLLPGGRGSSAETAANSPSAVSLLRPTELERPGSWPEQLDSLISQMEAEVAQLKPGATEQAQTDYIRRHVELRLLYLMAAHPERALTAIPGIDSADQEFWQQLLWSMTNYFDAEHIPAAKDRAGQAVGQLATATQRLREKADLEIRNMAFCTEIAYFGNFVRFPRDEFQPGDRVLLYAEFENYKSELTVDGDYRTLIRSTLEILTPSGEVRWHKEFDTKEDLCINYRRDYFHNYDFSIPNNLSLGPHILKLTIFDELSGKMVSQSINFVVR